MLTIEQLEEVTKLYRTSLCEEIDAGDLFARNQKIHKWKITYRLIILRELVYWRFLDLIDQVLILEKNKKYVGSRILIRSAIETLAILLYCVRKMETIVSEGKGFDEFGIKTTRLLIGTKDNLSDHSPINVLTVLELASKNYPELLKAYDSLSETAHPNWDGLSRAYSDVYDKGMLTKFTNDTGRIYKDAQLSIITLMCSIFETEYNWWADAFVNFEKWIEENDAALETTMRRK